MKALTALAMASLAAATCCVANAGVVHTSTGLATATTTITFNEVVLGMGTVLTNQYSAYGLSFSGAFYEPQTRAFAPATSGNQIGNFYDPIGVTNLSWSVLFSADAGEAAFGIATNPNVTTVQALLDGVVVGSGSASTAYGGHDYFQITGLTFDEIRLTTTGDHQALIDNLQFTPAPSVPVPEPGGLALLSLGFLGIFLSSRRR